MEPDLVDPVAVPVEAHQLGLVAIDEGSVLARLGCAGELAEDLQRVEEVLGGVCRAAYRIGESDVGGDDVMTRQRLGLVGGGSPGHAGGCARACPWCGIHVDTVERMASESVGNEPARETPHPRLASLRSVSWRLLTATVGTCFRYRVTGLAAEAAFFAVLSLPPLIFGLAGSIYFIVRRVDPDQITYLRGEIIDLAAQVLTPESVHKIVVPTVNRVLQEPRFDVVSVGFVLALWSGSRALNVFVDTITIMYGLGGRRGIVRTRMLSFTLYVIGLVVGVIVLPLVLAGPRLVDKALPERADMLNTLYWPTIIVLSIAFLTTLYHLSVPVRTSWRYDIPGAALAFTIWVVGSYLLRVILESATTSIYGPLAAPIAVLLWLYLTSLAVLIGAAVNAAFDRVFPEPSTAGARLEILRRLTGRRTDADPRRPTDIDDV